VPGLAVALRLEVAPDAIEPLLRLGVQADGADLGLGGADRVERELGEAPLADPLDSLHHGLVPEPREEGRVDLRHAHAPGTPLRRLPDALPYELRRRLEPRPGLGAPADRRVRRRLPEPLDHLGGDFRVAGPAGLDL